MKVICMKLPHKIQYQGIIQNNGGPVRINLPADGRVLVDRQQPLEHLTVLLDGRALVDG